jgi:hypothetical protein
MAASAFEEALSLCTLCATIKADESSDVDQQWHVDEAAVKTIHQRYAFSLHQKGDFEGAVIQYIAGGSSAATVIALFPELIPHSLLASLQPSGLGPNLGLPSVVPPPAAMPRLSGMILNRAASALVSFCDHHRPAVAAAASAALAQRERDSAAAGSTKDLGAADPDERVRVAVLLDTVLLAANMGCSPPR